MSNAPDRLFVQLTSMGGTISYLADPYNGKPVHVYNLQSSIRLYALAELEQLASEYADGSDASGDLQSSSDALKFRLYLSMFLAWLAQKEREGR